MDMEYAQFTSSLSPLSAKYEWQIMQITIPRSIFYLLFLSALCRLWEALG